MDTNAEVSCTVSCLIYLLLVPICRLRLSMVSDFRVNVNFSSPTWYDPASVCAHCGSRLFSIVESAQGPPRSPEELASNLSSAFATYYTCSASAPLAEQPPPVRKAGNRNPSLRLRTDRHSGLPNCSQAEFPRTPTDPLSTADTLGLTWPSELSNPVALEKLLHVRSRLFSCKSVVCYFLHTFSTWNRKLPEQRGCRMRFITGFVRCALAT